MSAHIVPSATGSSFELFMVSGKASASGNTTLLTPTVGRRLRIRYVSYNPLTASEVGLRFGASGSIFLQNNVLANSVIMKDLKDFRFVQGAVDEPLVLNQSPAAITDWTVFYTEV